MATKKQRRRRAKEQRHEYVWIDDEGNELEADDARATSAATRGSSNGASARSGRQPDAPSWQRTFRRAAIFAPIMFVTVMLLSKDLTLFQQITQTAFIVAIFIPFSHFLDRMFHRSFQRRARRRGHADGKRGS